MNFLFPFLFFITHFLFSQTYFDYSNSYSKEDKINANTAINVIYLSNEEKKIFFYLNLVRNNPKVFLEKFLSIENQNIHKSICFSSRNKCNYINSLICGKLILIIS